jgi:sulfur-carrier protein adenylyltransferase/sulfurtransferase
LAPTPDETPRRRAQPVTCEGETASDVAGKLKVDRRRTDLNRMATPLTDLDVGVATIDTRDVHAIVAIARFAPSAENAQPWRFDVIDGDRMRIHVASRFDEPFDPHGTITQLAAGGLIETVRIAASCLGRSMHWVMSNHPVTATGPFTIDVTMEKDPTVQPDPLAEFITGRSVERTPYQLTPLTRSDMSELEAALSPDLAVRWLTSNKQRLAVARLNATATRVRLATREAFDANRQSLDWEDPLSKHGVPVDSLGIDPLTRKVFRWSMASWRRTALLSRIPGSAVGVQLQLDIVPGWCCSAHFVLSAPPAEPTPVESARATLRHGAALQRFWLTATQRGLSIQPGYAAIAFSRDDAGAPAVVERFAQTFAVPPESAVFAGRIGTARTRRRRRPERSRSMRRDVDQLMLSDEP